MFDHLTGYTDGPWQVDYDYDGGDPYGNIRIMPESSNYHVISILWQDDAPLPDFNAEQKANAQLIAAAPDLLKEYRAIRRALTNLREAQKNYIAFKNQGVLEPDYRDELEQLGALVGIYAIEADAILIGNK